MEEIGMNFINNPKRRMKMTFIYKTCKDHMILTEFELDKKPPSKAILTMISYSWKNLRDQFRKILK